VCADCPGQLSRDLDAAFPAFVAHHQDLVYGIALRMTKRPADAEDLAQETFIRAYRALQGYGPARIRDLRPRGWLASIVANLGRNKARRKQHSTTDLDAAPEVPSGANGTPEQVVERREAAMAWRARLEALPPRYGRAVALRHVDGLSYPELSEALGRPIGTVKSDVHRGVRLLREALADEVFEPEAEQIAQEVAT
jgi:RNA polymerase sigma factor (sigma-70 family)